MLISLFADAKSLGKNNLRQSLFADAKSLGKNNLRQSLFADAKSLLAKPKVLRAAAKAKLLQDGKNSLAAC